MWGTRGEIQEMEDCSTLRSRLTGPVPPCDEVELRTYLKTTVTRPRFHDAMLDGRGHSVVLVPKNRYGDETELIGKWTGQQQHE